MSAKIRRPWNQRLPRPLIQRVCRLVAAVTLSASLLGGVARAACQPELKATVPLRIDEGRITLTVTVNDADARFLLDTGAARSLVTEAAAERLGLARDPWVNTTMTGIGGIGRRPNANPRSLSLGGVQLVRRTINHDTSLTVGVMPLARAGDSPVDGLLGRDFLSLFDLDIDTRGRTLDLYTVDGCAGRFIPWTDAYTVIPVAMSISNADAVVLPVILNGTPLQAMMDSGASSSLLAASGMHRLGIDMASVAGDPTGVLAGVGARRLVVRRHRFHTLRVGNEDIPSPLLWVEPIRLLPIVDMLLGADWLAARHVWVSFATKQLFVAENGGR